MIVVVESATSRKEALGMNVTESNAGLNHQAQRPMRENSDRCKRNREDTKQRTPRYP